MFEFFKKLFGYKTAAPARQETPDEWSARLARQDAERAKRSEAIRQNNEALLKRIEARGIQRTHVIRGEPTLSRRMREELRRAGHRDGEPLTLEIPEDGVADVIQAGVDVGAALLQSTPQESAPDLPSHHCSSDSAPTHHSSSSESSSYVGSSGYSGSSDSGGSSSGGDSGGGSCGGGGGD